MYYANPWINLSNFLFPPIEPQYVYNDRGYLASEMWVNNIKDLHRIGGPAITDYNDNGTIKALHWYKNGHLHNEDGPALIEYYDNMKIKLKHWFLNGLLHCNEEPACIEYNKDGTKISEVWFFKGKIYRKDGPAYTRYINNEPNEEKWYKTDLS